MNREQRKQTFQHISSRQLYMYIPLFLLVCLFLTASCSNGSPVPGTTRLVLVPKAGEKTPSLAEMEQTRQILDQRIQSMSLQEANSQVLTTNGLSIQIDLLPFKGNKQETINNLLKSGLLEFWITGSTSLQVGDTFDPKPYTQYNPGNQPAFTGTDLDPNSLYASQQQSTNAYQINFAMKSDKAAAFGTFTSNHIGQVMTVTLDKQVITSATIQSTITGPAEITGNFTQAQAQNIVNILKSTPLPVALDISSQRTLS